jgi:hypothetical protein
MRDSSLVARTWTSSRRAFLIGLGVTYLAAFWSLWSQLDGLYGVEGIVPIVDTVERMRAALTGWGRWQVPTLFWFGAGAGVQHAACAAGVVGSCLLILGVLPRGACALLWALYLSFVSVGRPFLPFQWDALLLEAGLLACLYAPPGVLPYGRGERRPSAVVRFLLCWLVFRLVFKSGLVKLQSGDAVWRDLTALQYHYWTQPLPHRVSHYAHHLPYWFGAASVGVMFAIELVAPFLLFVPGRARNVGVAAIVFLMVVISATGNYGFFNLLTVVLCIPLLDDRAVRCLLRQRRSREEPLVTGVDQDAGPLARTRRALVVGFAVLALSVTAWQARWLPGVPAAVETSFMKLGRLSSFNAYGLFTNMTEARPEIVVEGSIDGSTWHAYGFRWKPGQLERAPRFAGPHMPRLDWQMWFAALGGRPPPWYESFLVALLEASPDVLALLRHDPFDGRPPLHVRGVLYHYRFGTPNERAAGRWWVRELVRPFGRTLSAMR